MRHTLHIMFGEEFRQTIINFKKHTLKYEDSSVSSYIQALLWSEKDKTTILEFIEKIKPQNHNTFISGIEEEYEVDFCLSKKFTENNKNDYIKDFFDNIFRQTVTINNPGDNHTLHLFFYLPLYNIEIWSTIKNIIEIIKKLPLDYHIDIIGLASDTAFLFTPKDKIEVLPLLRSKHIENEIRTITEIANIKKTDSSISNFIVLQNCQSEGLSLQLNSDVFTRIIGEFACIWVQQYYSFFSIIPSNKPIKAIGLSSLIFDRYYFIQYLLKRTYIHLLDNEKITQEKVTITKVEHYIQNLLKDKKNLFSNFWKKEIEPLLKDNKNKDHIIVEVIPKLSILFEETNKDLQSFLFDDKYSIPEKKSIMALLLGFDDKLFTGYSFNQSQLIIDDLEGQVVDIFIQANNDITTLKDEDEAKPVLSISKEVIKSPLPEIKKARESIREVTTYIRKNEEQLNKISLTKKDTIQATKRLAEDGTFVYKNNVFKLLPIYNEDINYDDKYTVKTPSKSPSIDLRENFTEIKNQGETNASTDFTLVGIYEYLLKSNKIKEYNLSEAFIYYNSRKNNETSKDESVSSFQNTISAFKYHGVCLDKYHPYKEIDLNTRPNDEAYLNAENYKITEIKEVNPNINDMRTALSEGYPIAISLKIYDSFAPNHTGFIFRPTEEEIKSQNYGHHAMIICGYSDEQRVFVVRNSWGEDFGDNGYCYISYSYIEDKTLLNNSFIITKTLSDISHNERVSNTQVNFDITDANILYAITKNLLKEEEYRLEKLKILDAGLRKSYYQLIEKLKINRFRQDLTNGKEVFINKKILEYSKLKSEAMDAKNFKLKLFNRITILHVFIISIISFLITPFIFINYFHTISSSPIESQWLPLIISCSLGFLLFIFYFPYRKRQKSLLIKELDDTLYHYARIIDKYKKELSITKLKMYLAGEFLDRFFDLTDNLKKKYNVMESFVGNLKEWYKIEKNEVKTMDSYTPDPFISLLNNNHLDVFFEKNKDNLIDKIKLSNFIKEYTIEEKDIIKFQRETKSAVIKSLHLTMKDFNIIHHILNNKKYEFLDDTYTDYKTLFPVLDRKSNVFLQLVSDISTETPNKVIFIHTSTDDDKKIWENTYKNSFSYSPNSDYIESPYKIILARSQNLDLNELGIIPNICGND